MSITKTAERPAAKPALSQAEIAERREQFSRARHENELEGAIFDPALEPIREAYIQGELDGDGYSAAVRAHYGIPTPEETLRRVRAGEKVPGYS